MWTTFFSTVYFSLWHTKLLIDIFTHSMQVKEICVVPIVCFCDTSVPSAKQNVVNKCRRGWFEQHGAITFFSFMTHTIARAKHSSLCTVVGRTVKPVICKQTSPNFLWFTTLAGLGRGSFTTSNRPQPASNSSRRQLEHFRFYTSAIFIASLALHAQTSLYPLERGSLQKGREEEANNNIACRKKRTGVDEGC